MKNAIAVGIIALFAGFSATSSADAESDSLKVAKEVKMYIAKEAKKSNMDLAKEYEKMHKVCGKARTWTKGCTFKEVKRGKEKFQFTKKSNGKIYYIPGYQRK